MAKTLILSIATALILSGGPLNLALSAQPSPKPTALVLSGGGAMGSFEVGALQYLYERDFLANVISSTSVGSVNALMLAHGGTTASQKAAFDKLKMIWQTELTFNQDMYVEAPWLQGISPRTRSAVINLFSGNIAADVPGFFGSFVLFPPYAIVQAGNLGADLIEGYNGLKNGSSIFTLEPTRAMIVKYLNAAAVANSGVELRIVTVSLDSGAIRYITQDGRVLETDGRQVAGNNPNVCFAERSAYNRAVAARRGASQMLGQASRMDRGEALKEYREAQAEEAKARKRLDQCLAAAVASGVANRLVVNVADGVMASSAIPCVFPPVALGDESYVDGGIRWVLPMKAALDFNTDSVVAINASPFGIQPARLGYRNANMLDIAERSVIEILHWEAQERHLDVAKSQAMQQRQKVWIVAPRIAVHDSMTIDPGLIDINIGYGYMRAADVMTAFGTVPPFNRPRPTRTESLFVDEAGDQVLASLSDAISMCRRECWEVEHQVFGKSISKGLFSSPRSPEVDPVPNPNALDDLRLLKNLLGILVSARAAKNGKLPSDAETWGDQWERHQWKPADVPGIGNTPWDRFVSFAGSREPATRLRTMLVKAPDKPEVYLLDPIKHWVTSPAALDRLAPGLGFAAVKVIPAAYLDAIPRGADIQ